MKRNEKLFKSSIIIIAITFLSRIIGFLRESFIAASLGASYSGDIYYFSMGIISLLFTSIGSAVSIALVPIISEIEVNKGVEESNIFINNIINILLIISSIIIIIVIFSSGLIVEKVANGFGSPEVEKVAKKSVSIIIFSVIPLAIQYIALSILQVSGQVAIASSNYLIFSLVIIVYSLFFTQNKGVELLSIVTVIAYMFQSIYFVFFMAKNGYKYSLKKVYLDSNVRELLKAMMPILIGGFALQINLIIDRSLATTLAEGSLTILNFGNRLNLFIYGIFSAIISHLIYPHLSKLNESDEKDLLISKIVSIMIFLITPIIIFSINNRYFITSVLFEYGNFNKNATTITSNVFMIYLPSMLFFSLRDLFHRLFYTEKMNKIPLKNTVHSVLLNIILNFIFIKKFKLYGIALATTISSMISCFELIYKYYNYRGKDFFRIKKLKEFTFFILVIIVTFILSNVLSYITSVGKNINILCELLILLINALIVFTIYLKILKASKIMYYKHIFDFIDLKLKDIRSKKIKWQRI